jgi:hypothetical protein
MKIGVYVFGLASVFAGILDLMLLVFSAFALAPLPFAAPHDHTAWGGNAYNLTVVGAALIAAEWLQPVSQRIRQHSGRGWGPATRRVPQS